MADDLICPHCGMEQYTHEPDEISALMCHTECEHCEKPFWYSVSVMRDYDPYIDDDEEAELSERGGEDGQDLPVRK